MRSVASQIVDYLIARIKTIDPNVTLRDAVVEREKTTHINLVPVDDTNFDDWSSLSHQGRSLELDVEIRVKQNLMSYQTAKDVSAQVETLLVGRHAVGEGHIKIERVAEPVDMSNEGEHDTTLLVTEYTIIYRVERSKPNTIT